MLPPLGWPQLARCFFYKRLSNYRCTRVQINSRATNGEFSCFAVTFRNIVTRGYLRLLRVPLKPEYGFTLAICNSASSIEWHGVLQAPSPLVLKDIFYYSYSDTIWTIKMRSFQEHQTKCRGNEHDWKNIAPNSLHKMCLGPSLASLKRCKMTPKYFT